MDFQAIIAAKRDGGENSREELAFLANGAAKATIPDYQLAAWLMAAYLNPLNPRETADLTRAMADSGERMDLTGLPKPWVDKHSTGGVGDKISIVLLPLLAACGLTVVKMSGRGLGITGGTIDKLSAIPGFRTNLSPTELKEQAKRIGLALTGQTPDLAPADKALYALRDVTATVSSIPLIVSSILSKKVAGGAENIVLDVKCGSGAFMKTRAEATALADGLIAAGKALGLNIRLAITDMDQPLGSAVGNALEVVEALRVLDPSSKIAPDSPTARFRHLCIELGGLTLYASGKAEGYDAGGILAEEALASGAAKAKAQEWFAAQGAIADLFSPGHSLVSAPVIRVVTNSGGHGWIMKIDAQSVGEVVVGLGGGRKRKTDEIDLSVGIESHIIVGSEVQPGQPLLTIHGQSASDAEQAEVRLRSAILLSPEPVTSKEIVLETR